MAKGKIEQDIVLKVTGAQDVKDAAKLIDAIDGKKAEVDVVADADKATRELAAIDAKLDALKNERANIDVTADTEKAAKQIAAIDRRVDKLDKLRVDIEVRADADKAVRDLKEVDQKADKLDRESVDIKVTANTTQAEGALDRLRTKGTSALGGIGGALKANIATAALAVGGAITAFAVKAVGDFQDVALGAGELRDALGVTAEEASRLQEVAGDIGIGVGTLESAIGKMNRTASSTPGLFDAIGAELARNRDGTINVTETFLNAVDALNKIPDATQRAAAAQQIFGRGWQGIAELIAAGADDVREALESVESGKIMSDKDIERGREFRDMLDEVKGVAEEASIQLGGGLVDAIEDVKTVAETVKGPLEDLAGWIGDVEDAVPGGGAAGSTLRGWAMGIVAPVTQIPRLLDAGADAIRRFRGESEAVNVEAVTNLGRRLFQETKDQAADAVDGIAWAYQGLGERLRNLSPQGQEWLETQREIAAATLEVADAAEEASAEWEAMADTISEQSFQEAIDQFNSLSELDLAQMRQNTVSSFDDVKAAIKTAAEEVEGWGRMDLTPDSFDELRGMPDQFGAITDAVSGMRSSIQTELKAAFDTGGIQEFSTKFDFFAGQVREQFTTMFRGMGLPEDQVQAQVNAILADLSLLPEQKEIIIQLTLAQEGRNALDLFMDEITGLEALNPEVDIKAKIAAGDIAGALAELNALRIAAGRDPIVLPSEVSRVGLERATQDAVTAANNYARNHPAVIPSKVNPNPTGAATAHANAQKTLTSYGPLIIGARIVPGATVRFDAGGTVGGDGGIAGERGPEILDGKYLTTGPTYVPPGTRVTSRKRTAVIINRRGGDGLRRYDNGGTVVAGPRTINVNVNAAVVGNRFDVARAVSRANGDIARLMGTRG